MTTSQRVVLCVEDDPDTLEMLKVLLQEAGYGFKSVNNCADALQIVRQGGLSVILLDNVLVDGTGIELCRQIRQFNQQTPIIFLSGSIYEGEDKLALQLGANAFLSKPCNLESLLATLKQFTSEK